MIPAEGKNSEPSNRSGRVRFSEGRTRARMRAPGRYSDDELPELQMDKRREAFESQTVEGFAQATRRRAEQTERNRAETNRFRARLDELMAEVRDNPQDNPYLKAAEVGTQNSMKIEMTMDPDLKFYDELSTLQRAFREGSISRAEYEAQRKLLDSKRRPENVPPFGASRQIQEY